MLKLISELMVESAELRNEIDDRMEQVKKMIVKIKHLEDGTEEKDEMTIKLNKELAELEQLNDKLEMMIVYTRYLISLNN
jgi:DNA repair exonuclease SbcCD ATPase subunit